MPRQKDPFTGEKFRVGTGADAPTPFSGLSKIKTEQWKAMGDAFDKMGEFVISGGFNAISQAFTGPINKLKTNIANGMEDALSPITGIGLEIVNNVFTELGDHINNLMKGLEGISVTLPTTGKEFNLLDQTIKTATAAFFGPFSLFAGLIFELQKLGEALVGTGLDIAEAKRQAQAFLDEREMANRPSSPTFSFDIADIERGLR